MPAIHGRTALFEGSASQAPRRIPAGFRQRHSRPRTVFHRPDGAARRRIASPGHRGVAETGRAVARNKAKRLIREVFRRNPVPGQQGVDVVVIPRRELFDASYASLETDFLAACRRCAARLAAHDSK